MQTDNLNQQQQQTEAVKTVAKHGLLGLYLIFGAILILIGSWGFYSVAEDIHEKDPIVQIDNSIEQAVHQVVSPLGADVMYGVSILGNEVVAIASVALALYFAVRRRWNDFMLILIGVGGAEIIVPLIKSMVQRHRPILDNPIQVINNYSFPSGHSFMSVVFYGALIYLLFRVIKSSAARVGLVLLAFAIIILVGMSRVYLGVHFVSDVLGGYMGGLAWLAFTITTLEIFERWHEYRAQRSTPRREAPQP